MTTNPPLAAASGAAQRAVPAQALRGRLTGGGGVRFGVGRRKMRSRAGDGAMLVQTTGGRRAAATAAVTRASKVRYPFVRTDKGGFARFYLS
jgi:hypothetical protein